MNTDRFSRYRLGSMAVMAFATLSSTAAVCLIKHFYVDTWFCVLFIDLVYLMVFFFEIEYERTHSRQYPDQLPLAVYLSLCMLCTYGIIFFSAAFFPTGVFNTDSDEHLQ